MAWNRRWWGVILLGLGGCASDLPEYAMPKRSLAAEISEAPLLVARMQAPEGPAVTLQKPTPGPSVAAPGLERPAGFGTDPTPAQPLVATSGSNGTLQTSLTSRGKVRVHVRAWVNGRPIFDEELMQAAGPELRRVLGVGDSQRSEKVTELFNTVMEQIIDQELMYQDAVRKLEKASPNSLEKMREYVDMEFEKSVAKMRKANVPEEQIRELEPTARRMMERNLIATEYARSRIMPSLPSLVGMREIRDYYDSHLNEFQTVDKIVWQDIFIRTSATLPTIEDARRFAEDLVNQCRTPDDFSRLMVYNEGYSKLRDGEGQGQMRGEIRPAELEEALFQLRPGAIGPVIALGDGVHLIRVTKREYKGQLPLDETVQKSIRKKLEAELADREYRRIVRELRLRSVVRLEKESP